MLLKAETALLLSFFLSPTVLAAPAPQSFSGSIGPFSATVGPGFACGSGLFGASGCIGTPNQPLPNYGPNYGPPPNYGPQPNYGYGNGRGWKQVMTEETEAAEIGEVAEVKTDT